MTLQLARKRVRVVTVRSDGAQSEHEPCERFTQSSSRVASSTPGCEDVLCALQDQALV